MPNVAKRERSGETTGCTTVYVNDGKNEVREFLGNLEESLRFEVFQEILGHTEDSSREHLNTFYIVSAHIIADEAEGKYGVKEEKFTSLCYAGHLPGYTMSYNHHGLM